MCKLEAFLQPDSVVKKKYYHNWIIIKICVNNIAFIKYLQQLIEVSDTSEKSQEYSINVSFFHKTAFMHIINV